MPKCPLQPSAGDDRLLCSVPVKRTWPHGKQKPYLDTKRSWIIRAHRTTVLDYGGLQTDCQLVGVIANRKQGSRDWATVEKPLCLEASPGQDGRAFLRASVPVGPLKGKHGWARLICWLWHRLPGLTWARYQQLGDDGQYLWQANHLNRNPDTTLVDQLELTTADENWEHYLEQPQQHTRRRPAANRS